MKLNFWPILNSNSIPLSSENCLSISHAEIVMKIVIRYTYSLLIPLPADDQYFKHLFFSFSKLTLLYLLHFIQDGNQVWCTCSVLDFQKEISRNLIVWINKSVQQSTYHSLCRWQNWANYCDNCRSIPSKTQLGIIYISFAALF